MSNKPKAAPRRNRQSDIARELGVTQQRADQIEKAALTKLRMRLNLDAARLRIALPPEK